MDGKCGLGGKRLNAVQKMSPHGTMRKMFGFFPQSWTRHLKFLELLEWQGNRSNFVLMRWLQQDSPSLQDGTGHQKGQASIRSLEFSAPLSILLQNGKRTRQTSMKTFSSDSTSESQPLSGSLWSCFPCPKSTSVEYSRHLQQNMISLLIWQSKYYLLHTWYPEWALETEL